MACVAVSLACAACGHSSQHVGSDPPTSNLIGGKFAGYLWDGEVTSVHGVWVVPRIQPGSRDGHASTWIGAEAPGDKTAPFIQIGTTEDRPLVGEPDTGINRYTAFWSDEPHGFHPVEMFTVDPGDRISATMTLHDQHWTLSIKDLSGGQSKTFTTAQEGSYGFNLAEWLQEDVTNARTNGPFPYPELAPTQFSGLTVNGRTPQNNDVQSQWISSAGRYYGTSPLNNGSFAVQRVTLSSIAGRYLQISVPEDTMLQRLNQDMDPRTGAPEGLVAADVQALARVMNETAESLRAEQWPANVRKLIHQLASEIHYEAGKLNALKNPNERTLEPVLTGVTPYGVEHETASSIHAILGIPYPQQ